MPCDLHEVGRSDAAVWRRDYAPCKTLASATQEKCGPCSDKERKVGPRPYPGLHFFAFLHTKYFLRETAVK